MLDFHYRCGLSNL